MKKTIPIITSIAAACLLLGKTNIQAAPGTWTNDLESVWSDPTNWLAGVVADGAGNTATFSNELASAVLVNLDSARTVGNLQFVQGVYTITNNGVDATNILTLDNGSAKPVVSVPAATTATIRRTVLAGTNGFILDGGGTFALFKQTGNPTNRISGNVILSNSVVAVQEGGTDFNVIDPALDSLGSFSFYGNSTLNLLSDASTGPSYGTTVNNLIVPEGEVGTIILPPRFNGTGDNTATAGTGLGGTLTGGGTFNVRTRYIRGNIVGDWSAFTGQINVTPDSGAADNEWRFGSSNGFPNSAVHLTGTTPMGMRYYVQPAVNGSTVIPVGVLSSDNPASYITGSSMPGRRLTYRVGARHTNATDTATFAGQLRNVTTGVDTTARLALIKEGAGTLILTATNSHGGGTTISSGVLQIGDGVSESGSLGIGPVTNNSALVISRGGTLTVPGAISGSGTLTNSGPGSTVRLTGTNTYTGATVITAGKVVVGSASTLTGGVTIADTASLGALVSGAGASSTLGSITFGAGCSHDFDLAGFGNPTVAVVSNTGAITLSGGNVTVNVAAAPFSLALGTFTLLEYGSRAGAGSFVLGTLPPNVTATLNDDTANNRVTLSVSAIFDPTLRWIGDALGVWDSANLANQIWRVIGSGTVTNYNDGAFVRFDDTATGTTNINVSAFLFPGTVIVNNTTLDYAFGGVGSISGTATLTKQGTGKLTVLTQNDFTGETTIDAGILQLGNGGDVGQLGFGDIANNAQLIVNRTNAVTVNGDISGTGSVTVIGLDTNSIVTFTPPSEVGSTYSGGTMVSNAIVEMGNARANGLDAAGTGLGMGPVTFYGTTGLNLFQSAAGGAGNATGNNGYDFGVALNVPAGSTLDYHVAPRSLETTTLTGAGTVMLRGAGIRCYVLGGNWSAFTGQIIFYGYLGIADLRLNSANDLPLAKVHLANFDGLGNIARMMNQGAGLLPYRLGELSGDYGTEINANNGDGGDAPASTIWIVGGLNTDSTFAGTTADPGNADHNFVKEGTGKWTMSGTNNHAGFTTVSNGVLALVDTAGLSNSVTVTVAAPGILDVSGRTNGPLSLGTAANVQTLAGDGTIRGSVVLGANGRLSPGFSIGTLTITNSVTLGGTNIMEVASTSTSDRLVAANITYGGTLVITNIGSIAGNNTFQLFSGTLGGSFASVVLPALPGVTWDTSNLGVNGSITAVGPTVNPNPTNITFQVTGGGTTLDLSWPDSHLGWLLQSNSVSLADNNSWITVLGSDLTNRVESALDPSKTNVFFRMQLP